VVGSCREDRKGAILQYRSKDALHWEFESTLIENDGRFGLMWECPDYFTLDGKQVLLCSPQDMLPEGFEFHTGNGTLCLIGQVDESKKHFTYEHSQSIDYGIDFYAPQTTLAPDGRRIMIAWMQNWDACDQQGAKERKWFGQMTLPREITIENGRLYQRPVRELLQHRSNKVEYKNVLLDGTVTLDGIEGRTVDLEITIRPKDKEKSFKKFAIWFAQNERFRTSLSFKPYESILKIDRKCSGSRRAFIHQRRSEVKTNDGELKLRLILDRFSAEVFVNDGEQTMTATIMTDLAAQGISFCTDGQVEMDITKYDLFKE
jgi:beta-fructofuranosidase